MTAAKVQGTSTVFLRLTADPPASFSFTRVHTFIWSRFSPFYRVCFFFSVRIVLHLVNIHVSVGLEASHLVTLNDT